MKFYPDEYIPNEGGCCGCLVNLLLLPLVLPIILVFSLVDKIIARKQKKKRMDMNDSSLQDFEVVEITE